MIGTKKAMGAFAQLALVLFGILFLMTIMPDVKAVVMEILQTVFK